MNKEITELASDLQKINYNNAHPRSLIKSSQGTLWVAKDLMRFQGDHRMLWSDCADAQADLSRRWAHMRTCSFEENAVPRHI